MKLLPKLKKTVSDFLLSEDGKISKKSVILLGSILGAAALSEVANAVIFCNPPYVNRWIHGNNMTVGYVAEQVVGTHGHGVTHQNICWCCGSSSGWCGPWSNWPCVP